jgi:hypothetical protein
MSLGSPLIAVLALGSSFAFATALSAQEVVFRYTSTATDNCKVLDGAQFDGDGIVLGCPGLAGNIVLVTEGDLRTTVSIGRDRAAAEQEPAARQGFAPFNRVHDTVEWRSLKGGAPFAIIQRWFISDNNALDRNGRPTPVPMLVVTRLAPACHVAYVDVRANPEPNMLARQAADRHARGFSCKDKPLIVGKRGRAIELAGR